MADRTTLALKACEGLSDKELEQRGAAGFSKMIERKRKYAMAARILAKANQQLAAEMKKMSIQIKILTAQVETLQALDTPVCDTQQAADILSGISKKGN